ncbi:MULTISPECIES: SDR family NAD(P)-dependent oxidoreductase [unclassified Micromonospora]|uniref:SDR family NAD(P)-dependent oxidoreductase n=1 Tax=unclassified Micromonospora TaxID=2617518 RepID=UPI001B375577|nr:MULTISPECIES: SDR family oxidoreductase [unclassified Micromonospora]MBQ1044773.1 SDR family oxidoreductase [Micromonospora sp. C72]MBQ1053988.1 SDR family oxidoreductase [Micromonospora sp. C32]
MGEQRRLAVVSGGGTGIGAAVARGLVDDGFDVIVVGRRGDVLEAAARRICAESGRDGAVTPVVADLTDPGQVGAVVDAVGERAVDAVVNNAGGYLGGSTDSLAGVADWWRANLDANVLTAVLLTEALLPALRRPGGRVVLLSSIAAQRGGGGPYSAAKAALHGWAYDLAAQLGPDQITVNVVSPGYVAETEFFGDRMTPEGHAKRVAATLVGRAGVPDDIAAAVSYLVGPSAGYVTGQVLGVNGGSVLGR